MGKGLACILLAASTCAFALNPGLDVNQYAHKSWTVREGFFKSAINTIAQTPDGYLWLGTDFGLLRFDGVKAGPWQPPPDQRLPSNRIHKLLVARDGTLWIGTATGLASWKDGRLRQYAEFSGQVVTAVFEDHEGSVWAGTVELSNAKLCAIRNGGVQCYGRDGSLGRSVFSIYEDKGNLWVGASSGLWRWKPGPPKLYPVPEGSGEITDVLGVDDGSLWFATRLGIRKLVDGKIEAHPPVGVGRARRLLRDRQGGVWIGTQDHGLVHVHQGKMDAFSQPDGLSADSVYALFEDREGSIWVATLNGLDRFRELPIPSFSVKQGLPPLVFAVLADLGGNVWLSASVLNRWNGAEITAYREHPLRTHADRQGSARQRTVTGSGLPEDGVQTLFQDIRGRIWASSLRGAGYLENDRFISSGVPGGYVSAMAEDDARNLWIANQDAGLIRLSPGGEIQQIPWTALGQKTAAITLAADPRDGGLWMGFFQGGLAYFKDGAVRASYAASDGLGQGGVNGLWVDGDGTVWAATEGGLSRLKNGRIATLTRKNGLPCDAVHWSIEDDDHALWLYLACGLVRIPRTELDAWAAAPNHAISATVFDPADGVRNRATATRSNPAVTKSPDGKLWFTQFDGLSVIDPKNLSFNRLPPPVQIEQIVADRKTYTADAALKLPALLRDLEIDYTALSLVAPEKVRFRYQLEGHDREWQDAGNRREAFYNDLPPRNYRFRVIAANNSGVWNETGASFDFSILPAYYQTTWFRLACAAALLALLGALHQLRLRYLARQFHMRLEERVSERTRIARDLHDTLLQSFQGVLLKFHAVTYALPDRPTEARKTLETVIEEARQAISEGRDAVQGLRSSAVLTEDLARAIGTLGERIAADQDSRTSPVFRVYVEGTSRKLAPTPRDELYRIAGEALRNAFRHAAAKRIEVDIHYDRRQLRLRIRDDGKGIDPQVLGEGGRAGHHGLPGMRERAKLLGGKLEIWSELNSGTEIELTISAAVAYANTPDARRQTSSGKGTS